ncbi:MAG: hypothetical protein OM95_00600 [Bdellovibrio sp. ArHS]|uniref:Na+/H+ antiporter subunit E n=1 Tax=Bdellovibrio sp. ArHS TaxID=1569284 RepID=UPI00058344C5|nr:Na+/H+ antiporter subunit E [Bdellovibrio sp. ArHS]KHD90054.1 MAG: hypothetical protein OM95_00600 [Bdellovibrio sp. ArHS]
MKKIRISMEIAIFFVHDFFIAVLHVAAALFRSNEHLQPVIVRMPTRLKNHRALWILSFIISLTPGSLVVDISRDQAILYIHFFHAPRPEDALKTLKSRYEERLLELFQQRNS